MLMISIPLALLFIERKNMEANNASILESFAFACRDLESVLIYVVGQPR